MKLWPLARPILPAGSAVCTKSRLALYLASGSRAMSGGALTRSGLLGRSLFRCRLLRRRILLIAADTTLERSNIMIGKLVRIERARFLVDQGPCQVEQVGVGLVVWNVSEIAVGLVDL